MDLFSDKYNKFINIKRFCIPIIGAISCGKSTIMNYLLPFHNMLETGEKVTTKFICIIRHKKEAKIPEIYNVKIEERDEKGRALTLLKRVKIYLRLQIQILIKAWLKL